MSISHKHRQVLGLPSLVAMIVGIAISQVGLVGVLQGVGMASLGAPWLVATAFLIAFVLALTYAASFSELALMMQSAGGLSTYTEVALGHFPALLATFSGYVVVNMFGLPAELILFDNIIRETLGLPAPPNLIPLLMLAVLTLLNIRGTDVFAALQNATTSVKLALMLATGVAMAWVPAITHQPLPSSTPHLTPGEAFSSSIALFFWCFVAAEFVCPMIEETRQPERNIPRAMLAGITTLGILYALYAFGAIRVLPRETLTDSAFPHLAYARAVFGQAGSAILLVFAGAATLGLINGILAGVSRMLYGMAQNGQALGVFARLHPKYGTPWIAIVFMAVLSGIPLVLLGSRPDTITTLVVAASVSWLLAYIIAHLDLVVLRLRHPSAARPFRSPLFPVPQLVGMAGMGYVIAHTPENVILVTGWVLGGVAVLSAGWVRFIMKRGLFEPDALAGSVPAPGQAEQHQASSPARDSAAS